MPTTTYAITAPILRATTASPGSITLSRHDDLRLFMAHERRRADLSAAAEARLLDGLAAASARVRIGRLVIRLGERLAAGATLETAGPC